VRPERAGEINTRTVDPGQFVQVGAVLATLVDPSRLRLRFKTSQGESLHAREGQRVTFRVTSEAGGGHGTAGRGEPAGAPHTARVYHVGDVADPSTRQVEVLAWVDDPGPLKPGFFAEVILATGTHPGALVVPESAVLASERGFVVYVIRDGRAQERLVTVGLRTGDGSVEIASGLQGGESIVVEGSDRLSHGIPVEVVKDEPAAAGQRG
jgi:membrane fusion protein, multidrug efflux system